MTLPKFRRKFALIPFATSAVLAISTLIAPSCRNSSNDDDLNESFIETDASGKKFLWAYGQVEVSFIGTPATILLKKKTPVQGVDSSAQYELSGAVKGSDGAVQARRDLAYVDFHPQKEKLLAFAYELSFEPRAGSANTIDIYAQLRKAGRSFPGFKKVFIGAALKPEEGKENSVQLTESLKVSVIAQGVYSGQWALHFPDAAKIINNPYQSVCQRVVQSPDQVPGQTPGQVVQSCHPIPANIDLCEGDPKRQGCRPDVPELKDVEALEVVETSDLEKLENQAPRYAIRPDAKEARIVFVSKNIATSDDTNARMCSSYFFAVGRSAHNQVNPACAITASHARSINGKLACSVTVKFNDAQTYEEKVCNIMAMTHNHPNAAAEGAIIQILK